MTITPAENGGYVVEHQMSNHMDGPYVPSQQHAISDAGALHAHVAKHFPASTQEEAEEAGE